MTKFLSDTLFKGSLTADKGLVLSANQNVVTTDQSYFLSTNYQNGIFVGWDVSAVYLGYSMGSLPIHIGTNGSGNFIVRTSGNTIVESGNLLVGTATNSGYKVDVNGEVRASLYRGANGAPLISFDAATNRVKLDGQGYGATAGHSLVVSDYLTVTGRAAFNTSIKVKGAVDTISYGISRPDAPALDSSPLAGIGARFNTLWYTGAGLSFYVSEGTDISSGYNVAEKLRLSPNGDLTAFNLAGTGTRMVVADATGKLGVQAVPTFSETDTLDSVTDRGAVTTNAITVGTTTINGNLLFNGGYVYGETSNGASFGFYPESGYYELATSSSANQGPILIFNSKYTGKQVGFYAGDTTYPGMLLYEQAPVGGDIAYWSLDRWAMTPNQNLVWAATSGGIAIAQGPYDLGMSREAAGVLQVNNGTAGTYASIKALNLTGSGYLNIANGRFNVDTYDTGSGGSNVNTYLELKNYNNDGYGEGLSLVYGRGTFAAPQSVQTGDVLGGIYFKAYSASAVRNLAYIESVVTGVGTYAKTKLHFATGADDTYAYVGMILDENAKLFLGYNLVDQGAYRLQVGGAIYASGALLTSLAGTGSRMVVADATGTLSTQAIPAAITNYVTTDTTQTISGQKTFSALTTIFDSNATATFIEGKASGVLYGGISFSLFVQFNAYPAATQGFLWKNGLGSNVMALSQTGVLNLETLAGTGTRMVVADTNGNLGVQSVPTGSLQGGVDADKVNSGTLSTGTTTVKQVSATTYSGVFFDYVVKNGTNVRVGSVVAITNGTDIESYETLSNDIGSTTNLTFTVTLSGGNINLNAVAATSGWTVIVSTRAI